MATLAQRTTHLTLLLFAVVLLNSQHQHSAALGVQKVISFICTADTSTWDMFIASFIVFFCYSIECDNTVGTLICITD